MARNNTIFQNNTSTVPENDPRIIRVPFDQQDLGARKSHLPTAGEVKNTRTITHVGGKGS